MMKKLIIFLSLVLLFSPYKLFAEKDNLENWQFEREIIIEKDKKYKAIMLDEDIYKAANLNLSDIRIIDEKGEFHPYYIESHYENVGNPYKEIYYEGEKVLSFNKDDDSFFDFKLIQDNMEDDFIINNLNLSLDLNQDFSKDLAIYGSYDNKKWDFLKNTNIFNIRSENTSKTNIILDDYLKYNYYRLSIIKNIEDIQIQSLLGVKSEDKKVNINSYQVEKTPEYAIESKNNKTQINIKNPSKLKIFKIEILTNDIFKRQYEVYLGEDFLLNKGTIHSSINGNIIDLNDNTLIEGDNSLNLIVFNQDDKPITIDNVIVGYYIDKLVFKADDGTNYSILYGNKDALSPLYDIVSYKNSIESEKQELVKFGEPKERTRPAVASKEFNMKPILNIIVIVTSLLLILFILKHISNKED